MYYTFHVFICTCIYKDKAILNDVYVLEIIQHYIVTHVLLSKYCHIQVDFYYCHCPFSDSTWEHCTLILFLNVSQVYYEWSS